MRVWWWMTSATMKFRNFSAKAGSSRDSSARARRRRIWRRSRSGSAAGSPCAAFSRPTDCVNLKRSASRCTRAASMLSMLPRISPSSSRAARASSSRGAPAGPVFSGMR
ncbi:hypothetical protein BC477_00975 [Clavibacter michiganensis subsp. michiganensis]|uniref:Uncharacterized protein n=1 Tax=Clavibacter michiganensis subsp. michiganensis TaxID=33013 RepID=A0A251XF16_CLAMM|nr:hypothetical protein BC477_00975 [Clavibacter michiganensis subsp. michiganensis]OUE00851.1 hypothetical protein CMMCAS07_15545 [Clavibacter michiganensis subsp. michiganensis]